jgi:hypothetical protein
VFWANGARTKEMAEALAREDCARRNRDERAWERQTA